jgi:capsid protein
VISEQGGDLDDVLIARQAELAMLDEMGIVTDSDPSEVSDAGLTQVRPAGSIDPFGDTEPPMEEEEYEEDKARFAQGLTPYGDFGAFKDGNKSR